MKLQRSCRLLDRWVVLSFLVFSQEMLATKPTVLDGFETEQTTAKSKTAGKHLSREGPWGSLELSAVYLEAPVALIESTPRPDQSPVWHFPGADEAALRRLFAQAGLAESVIAELLKPGRSKFEEGGTTVLPSPELVIDLPTSSRQVIYEVLARSPENPYHEVPQIISDDVNEWLNGTRLSETQKRIWQRMLWHKGRAVAFSDLSVMIQLAASNSEITAARSAMTRVKTFTASVRRGANTSPQTFLEYWSAGQRNREAIPLIRALLERAPGDTIDVTLLLPRLCRERLYTYPSLSDFTGGRLLDCNWTALNFFTKKPEPYYSDSRTSYLELTQNYEQVSKPSQLGDLVCFVSSNGDVFHSCVFIADDVVFTKNGENPLMPWLLMRLKTVALLYDRGRADKVVFFRSKPVSEGN